MEHTIEKSIMYNITELKNGLCDYIRLVLVHGK